MKKARCVSVAVLGLLVSAFTLKADSADSNSSTPDSASNPYTQYDADGVPLALTKPQGPRLSQEDIDDLHREQVEAARNKDWLLRGYEKQLQSHASTEGEDMSSNLYYELSTNKELAKLAGLPDLAPDDQDSLPTFRTGVPQQGHESSSLRSDATRTSAISLIGQGFHPLVTPLSAPEAGGLHDFNSSSLSVVAPFYAISTPSTPLASKPVDNSDEPADIDTPGAIAAKNDPLADPAMSDLTLDVLPDESIEHAREHQDNYNAMQLPEPMDADQLHKTQAASLAAPNAQNAAKTPPAPPVPAAPIEDPEAPTPVSKLPQINPVHAPIANPFDILDR